jgi:hypothetical protein
VYANIQDLIDEGLVTRRELSHNRFVYYPSGDLLPGFRPSDETAQIEGNKMLLAGKQMSADRTSGTLITATTTDSLNLNSPVNTVVVVGSQMSADRTSGISRREKLIAEYAHVQYESYDSSFAANWDMCVRKGIGDPAKTEISASPWVSPEFIKAHVDDLIPGKETIGLAINRIKGNEMPRSWLESAHEEADKLAARYGRDPSNPRGEVDEEIVIEEESEEDFEPQSRCVWQDIIGTKWNGSPRFGARCNEPCLEGSSHWCPKHYDEGVEQYGTGRIEADNEQPTIPE